MKIPQTDEPTLELESPPKHGAVTRIQSQEISVPQMLQTMIDRGVTTENVSALEKMVGLYERMQKTEAEKAFARDFVQLQREIPRIQATKAVPAKDGSVKYRYAPFEAVDEQLRPLALKWGFTYSFAEGPEQSPNHVTKICTVTHVAGHSRSNSFTVRIGAGPIHSSESQADGAAHTYAKRGALCDAFSIVVRGMDNDARLDGRPITLEQADELERRVKESNSNVVAFLRFAGAKTFKEIPSARYDACDEMLRKKEGRGK